MAFVDMLFDAGDVRFAGWKAEQGVVIGRPAVGRELQPGADEVMAHDWFPHDTASIHLRVGCQIRQGIAKGQYGERGA